MSHVRPRRTRSLRTHLAGLATALTLAACGEPATGPAPELTALPRTLTAAEQAAIAAGNEFSIALLREVNARKAGENVFISPFSAAAALGMTLNGANGETFDAMRSTLGLGGRTPQEINEAYRGLTSLLLSLDPSVDVGIANAIFYRQGFPVAPTFVEVNRAFFDAEVEGLDFANQAATLGRVNGWASAKTNGRIDEVLDEVSPNAIMFLMNALYFKGEWRTQFDPAETQPAPFRRDDGTEVSAPLMNRRKVPIRTGFSQGAQVAELPYGNGAYAMTVVLPPQGTTVDEYVAGLTPARWAQLLASLQDTEMDVALPRFRMEFEDEWKDVLSAMGMGIAFDDGRADFTGISPVGGLFLSFVKQNTFVDVNEEGTEAAAVTVVGVELTSAPPSFRADRPFLFAIRERLSGTLLFVGKLATP